MCAKCHADGERMKKTLTRRPNMSSSAALSARVARHQRAAVATLQQVLITLSTRADRAAFRFNIILLGASNRARIGVAAIDKGLPLPASRALIRALFEALRATYLVAGLITREAGRKPPEPADVRFLLANASYELTLHGRLIAAGRDAGASCLDCHAPGGLHHRIQEDEKPGASTHEDELGKTCAARGCHGFAANAMNEDFLHTDMHDLDLAPVLLEARAAGEGWVPAAFDRASAWSKALLVLALLTGTMLLLWLLGSLFGRPVKGKVYAALGGDMFRQRMLEMPGRRGKKKPASGNRRKGK